MSVLRSVLCFILGSTIPLLATPDPQIEIRPGEVTLAESFSLRVTGVPPGAKVRIDSWLADAAQRWWTSSAEFTANEKGIVDTAKDAPTAGSYSGVDPMGLLWSMSLPAEAALRTSYWHSSLEPMTVFFEAKLEDGPILKDKLIRRVANPDLSRAEIREDGIVGILLAPPSEKPLPAVIVLGGSEGGIPPESYVAQFANAGFAALGLAYFREKGLPDYLSEIPVEYFQKAAAWLGSRPEIDPARIGIVGTSIGGTAALLAATSIPEIRAVVTFNGGGVIFQSIDPNPEIRKREQSSFSRNGTSIPFVPISTPPLNAESLATAYYLRVFLGSLYAADKRVIDAATIPVEAIHGPILMLCGQADRLMGSPALGEIVYERLVNRNYPYDFELIAYNGAGHNIGATGFPGTPATLTQELIGAAQTPYSFGGTPKDIARSRSASWERALTFLTEALKPLPESTLEPSPTPTPSPKSSPKAPSKKEKSKRR